MTDSYHLDELKIALDPAHPGHSMPPAAAADARVLDVGCGAGQTLLAAYPERRTFGMDIDLEALRLGRTLTQSVEFVCGRAEALPYRSAQFDIVVARVSLAYTDIGQSVAEIRRVLRPGGTVWMTLHPFSLYRDRIRSANWKGKVFLAYIVANGLCFHFLARQFRFRGQQESFQTEAAMRRTLQRAGFKDIRVDRTRAFAVIAKV